MASFKPAVSQALHLSSMALLHGFPSIYWGTHVQRSCPQLMYFGNLEKIVRLQLWAIAGYNIFHFEKLRPYVIKRKRKRKLIDSLFTGHICIDMK